jgi:hypothetical protein
MSSNSHRETLPDGQILLMESDNFFIEETT